MKQQFTFVLSGVSLLVLFSLSNCCSPKNCCRGYTGRVTDSSAVALEAKDHFILKDSIIEWTARYQANKPLICHDSLPPVGNVLGDSCSFNRCFVKALLCHDSCIGLRVIYGMDSEKKVHIILVGVKYDYTSLYIRRPWGCYVSKTSIFPGAFINDNDNSKSMRGKGSAGDGFDGYGSSETISSMLPPGDVGGLEYAQRP
jgi:hypothetical protein